MTRFSIHHPKCAIGHHDGRCQDASGMSFDGFPQTKEEYKSRTMEDIAQAALTKELMVGLLKLLIPLDDKRIQRLLAEDGVSIKWIELQEYLEMCRQLYLPPTVIEGEYVDAGGATLAERLSQVDSSGTMMSLPPMRVKGLLPGGHEGGHDEDVMHMPWGGL